MKRLLTLIVFIFAICICSLHSQEAKVIDRSAKSAPEWLSSPPRGFLVVEVESPDMSSARNKAIEELATRIVMSVAANVAHTSISEGKSESVDGKLSENESFEFNTKIAAANIPFIKGISLSEAKDSYWEKCKEKKTDRIYYRFAVLYPFSDSQLEQMRRDFEASDMEKSESMKALKENLDKTTSSLQIEQAITELEKLKEYFFDDVRRKEAEGLQANYKKLYKSLTLKATKPQGGKFTVTLMLRGLPFEVTGIPVLKSNCATRLEATPLPNGNSFEISYDDIDCLSEEDNWIEVSLRMRDAKIVQKVYL